MDRPVLQSLGEPVLYPCVISSDGPVLQPHVTAQFYLESKGKYILEVWGWADPKEEKKRKALSPILAPLFLCFFSSPEPALYKLGQPGGLFVLPEVLTPVLRPSFVLFLWTFSFVFLATAILGSFFLFQLPNVNIPSRFIKCQIKAPQLTTGICNQKYTFTKVLKCVFDYIWISNSKWSHTYHHLCMSK